MTDVQRLMAEYIGSGSEAAFGELVTRYIDLVHSVALRLVGGDIHLAEDVCQIVFAELARKASSLPRDVMLGGWLHRHTCFVAATTMRRERRRRYREKQAVEMNMLHGNSGPGFSQTAPVLDEAINELPEPDRTAVLLRFFEEYDFRRIGEAFGSNEDAARMRVNRALEKLALLLKRRGISSTATALFVALSANAVQSAPLGLSASVVGAALLQTTAVTTATITTKALAMTTIQKALVGAAATLLIGTAVYQTHQAAGLRARVEALQQRAASLGEKMVQLQQDRDTAMKRLTVLAAEVGHSNSNSGELLRLRGEVGRLRAESQALARLAASGPGAEPGSEEAAWLERVRLLKQKLDQTPGAKIPELQFLTHYDWLTAANNKLETEDDYLLAFRELRSSAVANFVRTLEIALQKYVQANNGQFPAELAQLKPLFETPPADEVLERYKIVSPGSPRGGENTNQWAITLRSPQDGGNWTVTPGGSSTFVDNAQMAILAPAMKAALDAAPVINGARRLDIHQLAPYLTTAEQRAAYAELLRNSK